MEAVEGVTTMCTICPESARPGNGDAAEDRSKTTNEFRRRINQSRKNNGAENV